MRKRHQQTCVDCGRVFMAYGDQQIRCPDCQREHRREYDRQRHRRSYEYRREVKTDSMVVNGHVQVCRCLHKCFYGQDAKSGCAYVLEEGRSRLSQGLYIVDGKCPAYRPKKRGDELRRSNPKTINSDGLSSREIINSFSEV